jgi:hypothetical protein
MALSIEFGITRTYTIGACFYVVCAFLIVRSCQANRMGEARRSAADAAASSASGRL